MQDHDELEYENTMFGDKRTRWYQIAACNATEDALEAGISRILIEHPTGAGKTITSGMVFSSPRVRRALGINIDRPLRLLFIAHKHRLLTQAEQTYAAAHNVEFISQSAMSKLPDDIEWDIACIDECHHEAMSTIQLHLDRVGEKPIIGLTATPDRADGMLIKFERIINPITREQAVAEGWLAETYLNTIVDSPAKDKTQITTDVIDNFGEQFGQTMMFFRTKREVAAVHAHLESMGYNAVAILGQNEKELNVILDDFSVGKHQFILNCNRINEGVDVVGCTDIYLGRKFGSYPQINQVIGRASRPDSDCVVWELIDPVSSKTLDTTVVVGTPATHRLLSKRNNEWFEQTFDYTSKRVDGLWDDKKVL